jgi:methylenetetrahydrofolate dehydrogenase (NADP+)/methenyltetrahydrofolate cyclohydrolase
MNCKIIDGNTISAEIRKDLKQRIQEFNSEWGITPTLVALQVGNDPASQIYINKKIETCKEVGINASCIRVSTKDELHEQIQYLNKDNSVHGYILQLPLPMDFDPRDFFGKFNPEKDVDVFHPENVGRLIQGRPRFKPCTPHGIQVMLYKSGIQIAGKKVVVINRSNVVGKPLSSMLIQECDDYANATVTICHDRTPPELLKVICLTSDIIIVAVGKPGFLTADMVQPGATVIDVGIVRQGNKILGDVDFENVSKVAGAISRVPGGVGPMTICMLLENTFEAAKLMRNRLYNHKIPVV